MMLDVVYTAAPGARQEPRPDTPGPDTTPDVAGPAPLRFPRTTLRDCVRQRPPRPPVDPTETFYREVVNDPPVGVRRGLFTPEEARPGGAGEIVDLVYGALQRDPDAVAWLGDRGIDLDAVRDLVRARGRR